MQNVKTFTEYDKATGEILSTGSCSGRTPELPSGVARIEGSFSPRINYVDVPSQTAKQRLVFAVQQSRIENTIKVQAIPFGTKVSVFGEIFDVDDGVFELEIDQPSKVKIILTHPCYFTQEFLI